MYLFYFPFFISCLGAAGRQHIKYSKQTPLDRIRAVIRGENNITGLLYKAVVKITELPP